MARAAGERRERRCVCFIESVMLLKGLRRRKERRKRQQLLGSAAPDTTRAWLGVA